MGIGNSRLSPRRGVRNHTMTDFIAFERRPIRDIFHIILFLLERLLFDQSSWIWYQIDQNSMVHGAVYELVITCTVFDPKKKTPNFS